MTTLRTSGTVRYAFATRITDLATNTTLGTATRHDYASINVDIAETASRTFLSVRLMVTFRDRFTVANLFTGIRMGIKLGVAATDDLDKTWSLTTTNHEEFGTFSRDVTDYFNTNYGAGSTQTCVGSIAASTTSASNINGNICAWLELVYQYDDSSGTTRTKTIGIPIQSQSSTLTTAQQEIGTDGTTPAPANQIPALDTYLPEASKTYKNSYVEVFSNDEATTTTNFVPQVQIDAAGAVARGTVDETLWASGANQPYRDIFNYDTGTFSTASTHAFKMACDPTTSARLLWCGGVLWVTYTYDASSTTTIINQVLTGLTQAGDDSQGYNNYGESSVASGPDKQILVAEVWVQEPGSITLVQSCAFIDIIITSTYVGNPTIAAGSQTERPYSGGASTSGEHVIVHRADHSSGWTLARGRNRLAVSVRVSAASTRHTLQHAWALVTWTSGVPSTGCTTGARFSHFLVCGTQTTANPQDIATGTQRAPNLGAAWRLLGSLIEEHPAVGAVLIQVGQYWLSGEFDSSGMPNWDCQTSIGHAQLAWKMCMLSTWYLCNRHSLATGRLDPTQTRRFLSAAAQSNHTIDAVRILSFNNITFTVSGVVQLDGTPVADGKTVKIWCIDSAGVAEHITDTTTTIGIGWFSVEVPDNTRTYFATYKDGSTLGRSDDGTPGAGSFNIAMHSGGGGGSPPTDSASASFAADYQTAKDQPITYTVSDASGVAYVKVSVKFSDRVAEEVVYEGTGTPSGFAAPYNLYSSVQVTTFGGQPAIIITARRNDGWPPGVTVSFKGQAVDTKGNVLT